jgi:hypothetical protein
MLAMKTSSVEVEINESRVVALARTRRDTLSAVLPELQLRYQDSEITVTDWDRIRLNPKPNYPL